MQEKLYRVGEAAEKIGLDEAVVKSWLESRIIEASAMADGEEPLFAEGDFDQLRQIKSLHEIGYATQEIRKIQRKVGLPSPKQKKRRAGGVQQMLTVGELAKRSGFNARTIKYWEERGIIEPSTRSEGGHRLYNDYYIYLCQLIHDLQLFGYSLEEIKGIAEHFRMFNVISEGDFDGSDEQKLENFGQMLGKIEQLYERMEQLQQGMDRWKKLLREKKADILSMKKKLTREQEKDARKTVAKIESPS